MRDFFELIEAVMDVNTPQGNVSTITDVLL